VLVAYGGSRQERWMVRNLPALDVGVALGIGGTLDFLAGRVRRAPLWIRQARLEWLFRLVIQPWRWRRQLHAARFFPLIALHTPRERRRAAERSSRQSRENNENRVALVARGVRDPHAPCDTCTLRVRPTQRRIAVEKRPLCVDLDRCPAAEPPRSSRVCS